MREYTHRTLKAHLRVVVQKIVDFWQVVISALLCWVGDLSFGLLSWRRGSGTLEARVGAGAQTCWWSVCKDARSQGGHSDRGGCSEVHYGWKEEKTQVSPDA